MKPPLWERDLVEGSSMLAGFLVLCSQLCLRFLVLLRSPAAAVDKVYQETASSDLAHAIGMADHGSQSQLV